MPLCKIEEVEIIPVSFFGNLGFVLLITAHHLGNNFLSPNQAQQWHPFFVAASYGVWNMEYLSSRWWLITLICNRR